MTGPRSDDYVKPEDWARMRIDEVLEQTGWAVYVARPASGRVR